ncbi:MAG: GNAT family N-acetyltransferase [Bryobacter sp.]|nr:GNAT family N-acetyltransferase [Bryobacter sp.]
MLKIRTAHFPAEKALVVALLSEYEQSLGIRLCFQCFATELETLESFYLRIWLLDPQDGTGAMGCVALREAAPGVAEMKRLYAATSVRGQGWGRRLAQTAIAEARALGYQELILDTIEARMPAAVALYRDLGFQQYGRRQVAGHELLDLKLMLGNG